MVPGFHGLDLIVILVVALLIFGPKRLPEMGSAIGKSIKEFKKGMNELTAHKEEETPKSQANLEAIDREVASKKTVSEYNATGTDGEVVAKTTSTTETTHE